MENTGFTEGEMGLCRECFAFLSIRSMGLAMEWDSISPFQGIGLIG